MKIQENKLMRSLVVYKYFYNFTSILKILFKMLPRIHCNKSECRSTQGDICEAIFLQRENEETMQDWPKTDDGYFLCLDCDSHWKDHGNGNRKSTCSVQSNHCPCLVTREQFKNITECTQLHGLSCGLCRHPLNCHAEELVEVVQRKNQQLESAITESDRSKGIHSFKKRSSNNMKMSGHVRKMSTNNSDKKLIAYYNKWFSDKVTTFESNEKDYWEKRIKQQKLDIKDIAYVTTSEYYYQKKIYCCFNNYDLQDLQRDFMWSKEVFTKYVKNMYVEGITYIRYDGFGICFLFPDLEYFCRIHPIHDFRNHDIFQTRFTFEKPSNMQKFVIQDYYIIQNMYNIKQNVSYSLGQKKNISFLSM